jgi:hypothetical protein
MDRVYRIITSFTSEQSEKGLQKFSDFELKQIIELVDQTHNYTFKYDGNVCHWREGDLEYNIFFCDEKTIEKLRKFDEIAHEEFEGYTQIDDITDDVLLDRFDTSIFGFFKFEMEFDFFKYRKDHITKDHILDKILTYGTDSLSENEKLFLDDKEMVSPIDEI